MKKFILIFMPILVIISISSIIMNKDLTFIGFIRGISELDLKVVNIEKIAQEFQALNFADSWSNVNDVIDFFEAIYDSIVNIGGAITTSLKFILLVLESFVANTIDITRFVFNYLLGY